MPGPALVLIILTKNKEKELFVPNIPALCDRCGQARLSQVQIRDETMHIRDHREGPCPCGGEFRILDGTYVHLGGPINICNTSDESIAKFKEALRSLAC